MLKKPSQYVDHGRCPRLRTYRPLHDPTAITGTLNLSLDVIFRYLLMPPCPGRVANKLMISALVRYPGSRLMTRALKRSREWRGYANWHSFPYHVDGMMHGKNNEKSRRQQGIWDTTDAHLLLGQWHMPNSGSSTLPGAPSHVYVCRPQIVPALRPLNGCANLPYIGRWGYRRVQHIQHRKREGQKIF